MAEPEDRANAISTPEIEEVRIFPGLEFAMGAVFLLAILKRDAAKHLSFA
ncbi:MAG: hypothetical protein ABR923_13420 [Terracidiphilus sp.]|jgi:hypothetical protein